MNQMVVTNNSGRPFLVRVVEAGGKYGLDDKLRHEKADPLIEFYDMSIKGPGFGPRGQFVSRYYASTLAEHDPQRGISLMGYEPAWSIDAPALRPVLALAKRLASEAHEKEKSARYESARKRGKQFNPVSDALQKRLMDAFVKGEPPGIVGPKIFREFGIPTSDDDQKSLLWTARTWAETPKSSVRALPPDRRFPWQRGRDPVTQYINWLGDALETAYREG